MEVNGKHLLVCNCNGTMPLDGKALGAACAGGAPSAGGLEVHTLLCRTQLARFEEALRQNRPVLVACTQEAPLFAEARAEAGIDTDIRFVNIREHAGWSDEGERATPKIAAACPEHAIRLDPGFDFTPTARIAATLHEAADRSQSPPRPAPGRDSRSHDRP